MLHITDKEIIKVREKISAIRKTIEKIKQRAGS